MTTATNPTNVCVEPIPIVPPGQDQYIGFKITAPWMEGYIRLRFPENIDSRMGRHFLDQVQPDVPRVSQLKMPEWKHDKETGAYSYVAESDEGVRFGGSAVVDDDVIEMAYWNVNNTGSEQDFTSQICFDMLPSPTFNERDTLATTYVWFDGKYQCLDNATCSDSKYEQTGFNWIIMLCKDNPNEALRAIEDECMWWIVNEQADYPLIVRETPDGKHLVALTIDRGVGHLMTNTNIPCLHTDPLNADNIQPDEKVVWTGRIYMMENDPEKLLERFKKDVKAGR